MPKNPEPNPKRLEIRKYPNRRYYDTTRSRHLTLDEIRNLIQEGYDIRVVDSQTEVDITSQVLAQIILNLETQKLDLFPAEFLTRMIRMNDQLLKDYFGNFLGQSLLSIMELHQRLTDQYRLSGYPPLATPTPQWPNPFWPPFMGPLSSAPKPEENQESAAPTAAPQEPAPEQQLQEKIRQLEGLLSQLQAQVGGRARTKRQRAGKRADK